MKYEDLKEKLEKRITEKLRDWDFGNYAKKDLSERQDFDQFFTPADKCAMLLAQMDSVKDAYERGVEKITKIPLFDPTAGCGNLLAAGIAIGWDPKWVYANELDIVIFQVLKDNLKELGVPEDHIKLGDVGNIDESFFEKMIKGEPIASIFPKEINKVSFEKLEDIEKKLYTASYKVKKGNKVYTGKYLRKVSILEKLREGKKVEIKKEKKEKNYEELILKKEPISLKDFEKYQPENYTANPKDGGATYIYSEPKTKNKGFSLNKKRNGIIP